MKILFCVEVYFPSMGGAQEVVRQLAERMAAYGHEVCVATSRVRSRTFQYNKGVRIEEFGISGNQVRGLAGEVERYRQFLADSDFDLVFFYAAQQWTFDAAWDVMDQIRGKKVVVPCGYSGLINPAYGRYFADLPMVLRKCDHLVYHASDYRDVEFGRANGLNDYTVIPNGADDVEFSVPNDAGFRTRYGIAENVVVLLTVGTVTGLKGHAEVLKAFDDATFGERPAVLFLNGNEPEWNGEHATVFRTLSGRRRLYGWKYAIKHGTKQMLWRCGVRVGKAGSVRERAASMNKRWHGQKRVIVCNLPRTELVQAYLNADLFVFASNIEYSPLVLFESCAAGLPFISVPVGNSEEIATWTGGGEICPAQLDERGYVRVPSGDLARQIEALISNEERRVELGRSGRVAWKNRYNWQSLSKEYEVLFTKLLGNSPVV